MYRYLKINPETGIAGTECLLRDMGMEKKDPYLIPVDMGFIHANKKWDFDTETWVEYVPEETEPVEPESTPNPIMEKLDSIEAKIQTNEDLQTFYDDIVKEVGL